MNVRNKNCFRSQGGAMIEITCRPDATDCASPQHKIQTDLHAETAPPGKRKAVSRIIQKRYYFYD